MQNLPLPMIPVQYIFYLRKLWVNCFGIKTMKSEIFLYHKGVAHKGSNEIGSMLLKNIETNIPSNVKNLYFFSDGTCGQNWNHTMIRFCLALADTGHFEQIFHYFLVQGHSYLPNYQDFGTNKRMICKNDRIYTPDEYEELCAQSSNSFHVTKLLSTDVKDVDGWSKEYHTKNPLAREVPNEANFKFAPTRYSELCYNSKEKGVIAAYTSIDGLQKHSCQLLEPASWNIDIDFPSSIAAYPSRKVPINIKKM
ncbi:uncharacterized protein LOC126251934 [Schistocerca nitens]|uniref:uncharacterized protein LOC126251934 n=1 Tax=Schistocerca nitens TaxID=7011 RepID=UPI0021196951|nr:uncharacterized protein LOC126251934 [Schistocerca nitens]